MIPLDLLNQNPMLCVSSKAHAPTPAQAVTVLQQRGTYLFEIKLDGIRGMAFIDAGVVRLRTRTGEDLNARYPDIVERLEQVYAKRTVVLDGEIVCLDPATGLPDFNRGQKRSSQSTPAKIAVVVVSHPATFIVFDLLYNGDDLRNIPLVARQALLATESATFAGDPRVQLSLSSPDGETMWAFAREHGLEGLIAKDRMGVYRGRRDSGWIKLKDCLRVSVIITGYEYGSGARAGVIGAMFMGLLDANGELVKVGRVGTGLKSRDHAPLMAVLPRLDSKGTVLEAGQEILVEVECMPPTTGDKQLRFPAFKYVRSDVTRDECTLAQLS